MTYSKEARTKIDGLNLLTGRPPVPEKGNRWTDDIMTKYNTANSFYYFECISSDRSGNYPEIGIELKVLKL